MTRGEWREFASDLTDKVLHALDYYCHEIDGRPLECYSARADLGLAGLAEEFADWITFGITKRDLELLEEMPDDIYEEYDKFVRESIERLVDELHETYCEDIKEELREAIERNDEEEIKYIKEDLEKYGCA